MFSTLQKYRQSFLFRALVTILLMAFVSLLPGQIGYTQILPRSGILQLSQPFVPPSLIGLKLNLKNPLEMNFLMDRGEEKLSGPDQKETYTKLIKYFLASLTIPDDHLWVNLSPNEPNRIVEKDLGQTQMGLDLLGQDYLLKQITASLMYPENEIGKKFWDKVNAEVKAKYGNVDIPVDTFNKVWIIPDQAIVYEKENTAWVLYVHLKVMVESDYQKFVSLREAPLHGATKQSAEKIATLPDGRQVARNDNVINILKQTIIPELEKEVNSGKNFAPLRQIVNSMILATWYKKALKNSLLGKSYVDQGKVSGVVSQDQDGKMKIYNQYLETFKKGVYNYIKEEYDPITQEVIPRKYFSGGVAYDDEIVKLANDESLKDLPEDVRLRIAKKWAGLRGGVDEVKSQLKGTTGHGMKTDREIFIDRLLKRQPYWINERELSDLLRPYEGNIYRFDWSWSLDFLSEYWKNIAAILKTYPKIENFLFENAFPHLNDLWRRIKTRDHVYRNIFYHLHYEKSLWPLLEVLFTKIAQIGRDQSGSVLYRLIIESFPYAVGSLESSSLEDSISSLEELASHPSLLKGIEDLLAMHQWMISSHENFDSDMKEGNQQQTLKWLVDLKRNKKKIEDFTKSPNLWIRTYAENIRSKSSFEKRINEVIRVREKVKMQNPEHRISKLRKPLQKALASLQLKNEWTKIDSYLRTENDDRVEWLVEPLLKELQHEINYYNHADGALYIREKNRRLYFRKDHNFEEREVGLPMHLDRNNPLRELLGYSIGRKIGANTAETIIDIQHRIIYSAFSLTTDESTLPQKTIQAAEGAQLVFNVFVRKWDDHKKMIQRGRVGNTFISFDQDSAFNVHDYSDIKQYLKILRFMINNKDQDWSVDDFDKKTIQKTIKRVKELDIRALLEEIMPKKGNIAPMITREELLEFLLERQKNIEEEVKATFKVMTGEDLVLEEPAAADPAMKTEAPGGIDLNPANTNMQIKREGNAPSMPLEFPEEGNLQNIHIDGLVPVILNITPATLPSFLSKMEQSVSHELSLSQN